MYIYVGDLISDVTAVSDHANLKDIQLIYSKSFRIFENILKLFVPSQIMTA